MEIEFQAVTASVDGPGGVSEEYVAPISGLSGVTAVAVGPLEVRLSGHPDGFGWSVGNGGDRPSRLRALAVVGRVQGATEPLRMFRHGYQSWSPSGVAVLGVDDDPSRRADLPFVQGVYHADPRRTRAGELRSEWCTVLADADAGGTERQIVLGFDGGDRHDGTFRLSRGDEGRAELRIEAFLGGAELGPGRRRPLHGVSWARGSAEAASELLGRWAGVVGRASGARVDAPFQVGWCSWYRYFDEVTEADLRSNLAAAERWPFDVFQLDDGYQAAIGDWLDTNAKFPSRLETLAADIAARGMQPGIWLAPFLAAPDSELVRGHPDWVARSAGSDGDEPLRSWWNPAWGGGEDGFMYSLDTSRPEVQDHLEQIARELVDAGFDYLKLDFTFAPSVDGRWHDATLTPAERVRAGFDAIRRGAGDDAFILGCGVPLSNVVGVVDANRVGADVAPLWALDPGAEIVPGYLDVQPATRSAFAATVARSFMHRKLWMNDPDCIMLRTTSTDLEPDAAATWAQCVALSGGLVMVSDDLGVLGPEARARLDEVVALGRTSDAAAQRGHPPTSPDLLVHTVPTTLTTAGHELVADVETATSELRTR